MGIERHLFNVFVGESVALGKRWVVRARNIEDATGKVVEFCKEELAELDSRTEGDVNIDLKFRELEGDVVELNNA